MASGGALGNQAYRSDWGGPAKPYRKCSVIRPTDLIGASLFVSIRIPYRNDNKKKSIYATAKETRCEWYDEYKKGSAR